MTAVTTINFQQWDRLKALSILLDPLTITYMRGQVGNGWLGFVEIGSAMGEDAKATADPQAPEIWCRWAVTHPEPPDVMLDDSTPIRFGLVNFGLRYQTGAEGHVVQTFWQEVKTAFHAANNGDIGYLVEAVAQPTGAAAGLWTEEMAMPFQAGGGDMTEFGL